MSKIQQENGKFGFGGAFSSAGKLLLADWLILPRVPTATVGLTELDDFALFRLTIDCRVVPSVRIFHGRSMTLTGMFAVR